MNPERARGLEAEAFSFLPGGQRFFLLPLTWAPGSLLPSYGVSLAGRFCAGGRMCQIEQSLLGLKLNESVLKQPSEAGCYGEGSDAGGILGGSAVRYFSSGSAVLAVPRSPLSFQRAPGPPAHGREVEDDFIIFFWSVFVALEIRNQFCCGF